MEMMTLKLRGTSEDTALKKTKGRPEFSCAPSGGRPPQGGGPGGAQTYRSYYLVTDGGHMAGRGRASAIPMSSGAPMPDRDFIEVSQGGEERALKTLVDVLMALPGNHGLVAELNDRPS